MLATTHYMDEADYCNTIGMMYQGKLVALASPETLKNNLPGVLVQLECDRPGDVLNARFRNAWRAERHHPRRAGAPHPDKTPALNRRCRKLSPMPK